MKCCSRVQANHRTETSLIRFAHCFSSESGKETISTEAGSTLGIVFTSLGEDPGNLLCSRRSIYQLHSSNNGR